MSLGVIDLVTLNRFVLEQFPCGPILNPVVCEVVERPKRILAFMKVHI